MRNEQEIKELEQELSRLSGFISDYGTPKEFEEKEVAYICNVVDALDWVLGEIDSESFRFEDYLDLDALRRAVLVIEARTGKKLENYDTP